MDIYSNLVNEARVALDNGTYPVSAVILDSVGNILSIARNEVFPNAIYTEHAEMIAIRHALGKVRSIDGLSSCKIITTLEPCLMCAGAIWSSRISAVTWLMSDRICGAFSNNRLHIPEVEIVMEPSTEHRDELNRLWSLFHKINPTKRMKHEKCGKA